MLLCCIHAINPHELGVQISDELLQSQEFRSKHGSGGVEFEQARVWMEKMGQFHAAAEDVDYLYQKLLGRSPDPSA